jgi:hypothetical protein
MFRSTPLRITVVIGLVALLLALPAAAKRKPPAKPMSPAAKVLRDCVQDGDLDFVYKTDVVKRALKIMPSDVRNYTDCDDVLRARITAGRTVYVKRTRARLKVRCTRHRYGARITRDGKELAAGTVPACRRGTRVVSLRGSAPVSLKRAAHKHRTARVTLTPGAMVLRFVVELRPFRR